MVEMRTMERECPECGRKVYTTAGIRLDEDTEVLMGCNRCGHRFRIVVEKAGAGDVRGARRRD